MTGIAEQRLIAVHVGRAAQQLLRTDQPVQVMGVTSRGVFLRLAQEWVVFLSGEPWRGPLTLNVPSLPPGVQAGGAAAVAQGELRFAGGWSVAGIQSARPWETPAPPAARLPAQAQLSRLRETAGIVLARGGGRGLSYLLAPLLGLPQPAQVDPQAAARLGDLNAALGQQDWQAALAPAAWFLGRGTGLTPSGDDLLLGLLLGLGRAGGGEGAAAGKARFAQALLAEARGRTTSLSACLLSCASQAQVDERLSGALDGMLSGADPSGCAGLLLGWGSSSGCDALVGMALAILVESERG
jgi:hypothetical protein